MRSLNRCTFIGTLVTEPSRAEMADRTVTTRFILSVPENESRVTLVPVAGMGRVAETCNKILRKGAEVYIEGRWRTARIEGPNGENLISAEIAVENMQLFR